MKFFFDYRVARVKRNREAAVKALTGKRRARKAGLYYVNSFDDGLSRRRCGKGFTYLTARNKTVKAERTRARIQALVIPPAWTDVWICSRSNGHIQARGRDEAGRMQYLYHARWDAISQAVKFDRMQLFSELLPRIRRRVRKDLNGRKLTMQRVLAAIVRLLDKAQIRVGNEKYTKQRGSRGATTLGSEHVVVDDFRISLDFPGKSGKRREIEFSDRKVSRVIRQCNDLDGQYLFCYTNSDGEAFPVDSTRVNQYLQEISNESVTAKDFRTWWGSVVALANLAKLEEDAAQPARKRAINNAVRETAQVLGNTRAVCRRSYIHPGILAAAQSGELPALLKKSRRISCPKAEFTADERRYIKLLPYL